MGRTLVFSFAGAGIGFLAAFVIVQMMTGPSEARDTAAITLFVGTFLGGSGAIAGAIVGAVAEFANRSTQPRAVPLRRESGPDV
ncbi:MAG TPA: hypothetical protein VGF55_11025 [Gemmataceae bacterium]|jgi:hypothetical protein